jgi:GR25 family glycosyltransferase involved in LPS biosynthesis
MAKTPSVQPTTHIDKPRVSVVPTSISRVSVTMKLGDYIGSGKLFECAFCINLHCRKDRYDHVMGEFEKLGCVNQVEMLSAIEHRYGMVGCSLSHLECVKIAKARGMKSVLIFEDDIVVTPLFDLVYQRTLEQLKTKDWSVFHFGAMLMNIAQLEEPNLMRIGYNWAAHAVAIHERAYDFIIEKYDPSYSETDNTKPWGGHYPFDGFINKELFDVGYKIYTAYPCLLTQLPNHSDTWGYHRDYKNLLEDSYETQIVRAEVNVIVCSKNRPIQLHALLQSFKKYQRDPIPANIHVVYKADSEYREAYEVLKKVYKDVQFHSETNFKQDYVNLISKTSFVMFLVDDAVFFRPFKVSDGCVELATYPDTLSFSYRLGKNTTYSYINNFQFQPPVEYNTDAEIVRVDWRKEVPYIDFGYPFEISGSMYRSRDVLRMMELSSCGWDNPNYFELTGTTVVRGNRDVFGTHIATYPHSVTTCIPLNRVQGLHLNRCASFEGYTPELLVNAFLSGKELDLSAIPENWSPNSVHMELQLPFRLRS